MSRPPGTRLPVVGVRVRVVRRDGGAPTLADVDALCRLALALRRQGAWLEVDADEDLRALLALAGVADLLADRSVVQVQGQAEPREDG